MTLNHRQHKHQHTHKKWVFSSMDRIPCFELGDVGSIPAGPAKFVNSD